MTNKDKIKLGITGVLITILIFQIARGGKKAVKKVQERREKTLHSDVLTKEKDSAGLRQVAISPGGPKTSDDQTVYRRLEEDAKGLKLARDPFTEFRIAAEEASPSGPSLDGIIWDKETPMALINGRVFKVGEKIRGSIIVRIEKDRVILNDGSKYFELTLHKAE